MFPPHLSVIPPMCTVSAYEGEESRDYLVRAALNSVLWERLTMQPVISGWHLVLMGQISSQGAEFKDMPCSSQSRLQPFRMRDSVPYP